ncbi:MAG: hypothetical protein GF383_11285 [Candidatus Lokiarchaeota archaeon]|nr:hypothetical protein [Candidatus Lokiarchaeota archaeon]
MLCSKYCPLMCRTTFMVRMFDRLEIRLCLKLKPLHEGNFSSPPAVGILLWSRCIAYMLGTSIFKCCFKID